MDSKDKALMELASKSYKHGLLRLVCYGELISNVINLRLEEINNSLSLNGFICAFDRILDLETINEEKINKIIDDELSKDK